MSESTLRTLPIRITADWLGVSRDQGEVYPHVIAFASDPTLPKRQPAISARPGDDIQRGAGGPTEFGRKSVREHLHFLDGANRHGGDRRLTAPTFIVVRAVNHEC